MQNKIKKTISTNAAQNVQKYVHMRRASLDMLTHFKSLLFIKIPLFAFFLSVLIKMLIIKAGPIYIKFHFIKIFP